MGARRERRAWPVWARGLVSVGLLIHLASIVAGALAVPPSSELERLVAGWFGPYFQVIDQGYAYRYYAPEPPPTPVVTATIHYADGQPDATVRLPRREAFPWLLRQRQLALANHLYNDFNDAKFGGGDGSRSRWARSYARHLSRLYPGAERVDLHAQLHLIPDIERIRGDQDTRSKPLDMNSEEFFTTPERIGEYRCDAFVF